MMQRRCFKEFKNSIQLMNMLESISTILKDITVNVYSSWMFTSQTRTALLMYGLYTPV